MLCVFSNLPLISAFLGLGCKFPSGFYFFPVFFDFKLFLVIFESAYTSILTFYSLSNNLNGNKLDPRIVGQNGTKSKIPRFKLKSYTMAFGL